MTVIPAWVRVLWHTGLAAAAVLQLACVIPAVSTPEYPNTWPALETVPSGTCADVAGTYTNSSLRQDPESDQVQLLKTILGNFAYQGSYPSMVHLAQPDTGTLVITGLSEKGTVVRQELSVARGTLECTNEGLQIKVPSEVHPSDGGGLSRVFLSRSTDGSLILRDVDKAMMGVSGILILSHVRRWYRFPVAAEVPPSPVEPLPERLAAAETAVLEVGEDCRKKSCLQRLLEMDSRTLVYNQRFDPDLDTMRLPPGRYRFEIRFPKDSYYSPMEGTLTGGRHHLLRSEECKGDSLPVECPYRTDKRLLWLEEQGSGAIAGGKPWWNEVTYREHASPMVMELPKRQFWTGESRTARELSFHEDICDGVLIDRATIKNDRGKVGTNSPSGEARIVRFIVKLSVLQPG